MFKDYYQILDISYPSNFEEIKKAYKTQSKKWHPDKNLGCDTTTQMKDVNEAYNILKDINSKFRYDIEYDRFKQVVFEKIQKPNSYDYHYDIKDENLKNDVNKARRDAKEFVEEFLKLLKKEGGKAASGAWDEMVGYIIGGVVVAFVIFLIQKCSLLSY